jgi:hypothetical protein
LSLKQPEPTMQYQTNAPSIREPWKKGTLVDQKAPLMSARAV